MEFAVLISYQIFGGSTSDHLTLSIQWSWYTETGDHASKLSKLRLVTTSKVHQPVKTRRIFGINMSQRLSALFIYPFVRTYWVMQRRREHLKILEDHLFLLPSITVPSTEMFCGARSLHMSPRT